MHPNAIARTDAAVRQDARQWRAIAREPNGTIVSIIDCPDRRRLKRYARRWGRVIGVRRHVIRRID